MFAVPAPTIVIVEPETVATVASLEVYVIAPVLVELGAVISNAASPNVFVMAAMLPITGVPFATVIVVVTEPAL
jgi:hypothetical protein